MNRFARFAVTALCFTAMCHQGSRADDIATDANIITGLDISDW